MLRVRFWWSGKESTSFSFREVQPMRANIEQIATTNILVYGTCLREECEADHDLGYELMKRTIAVVETINGSQRSKCRACFPTVRPKKEVLLAKED
jgi:hypothetical protein